VFAFCGKLAGHYPVCGSLRIAAAFVKRRANSVTSTWDEEIHDECLSSMLKDMLQRETAHDPASGRWDVSGDEATAWVDASSLALGAVVEVNGCAVEDGTWLRHDDAAHINTRSRQGDEYGYHVEHEEASFVHRFSDCVSLGV